MINYLDGNNLRQLGSADYAAVRRWYESCSKEVARSPRPSDSSATSSLCDIFRETRHSPGQSVLSREGQEDG